MMTRVLDWVRAYTQLAWWDGSCVALRLDRVLDLIESAAAATDSGLTLMPVFAKRGERP